MRVLPFRAVRVDSLTGETRRPEFLKKNAAGRIPVLELENGAFLAESGAILLYLAQGSDLLPEEPLQRAQVLRWMFFEQNLLECTIGTARFFKKVGRDRERPDAYAHRMEAARDALLALDRGLEGQEWAALGRFTLADIALYGYVSVAEEAGLEMAELGNVVAWRKRVEALPRHVPPDWGF